ncbi:MULTISPECIES: membrane protein [Bacteroides]|uniref:membrane protein n=1 Tax=Bacteroides TaxID=816 RepID=UPI0005CC4E68|nr:MULTISPECIES: membrane protein [Bacteroides]
MNILRIKNKYVAVALFLMLAVTLQAQDYGALQYMLQKRPANEKFESNKFNEHLFFSAGIGPYSLLSGKEAQDGLGMTARLFMGKWITPVHGLRIGVNMGYLPSKIYDSKIKMGGGSLDYLLNMSSLAYGYNPNRRFELFGIAGVEAGYSKVGDNSERSEKYPNLKGGGEFYYGAHIGLQGNIRLSRTLDLFVEPQIGWYNDVLAHRGSWRNYQVGGSVLVGLTYMPAAPMGTKIHFDEFDNSSFQNHMFISLSGGISTLKVSGIKNTIKGLGPQFSAGIGKWFSPSSGLRLSGTVGFSDTPAGSKNRYFKHIDLHADYMLNLNNVLWGYDEDRVFNLIGIAGVNLAGTKGVENSGKYAPGIGVGVQGSFRLNRSMDLFIEPRLNVYHKRYAGGCGLRGTDQLGELNLGLTYHTIDRAARPKNGFSNNHISDNLFMTSGVGLQMFLNKKNFENLSSLGPQASVSLGKWLTAYSGLRLVGTGGFFTNYLVPGDIKEGRLRHISVSGGLDYLWNITSTMDGYNPDRIFDFIASVGVNLAYTNNSDHKFQPGINAGIQGLWHVNDFLGLYIEPQVRMYGDKFIEGNLGFMQKDVLVGVNAGFHYRFVPYSKAANRSVFDKDDKRYFISGALGMGSLLVGNKDLVKNAGVEAKGSFGKWYTPLSAWRINGTILYKSKAQNKLPLHYAGLGMDYMMSLATLTKGYSSDHVIDVVPFMGVTAGLSRRNGEFQVVPGLDAGVQFKLRVASSVYLYAEPKVGIRTDTYDGIKQGKPDYVASMVGGLLYRFKMPTFQ